MANIDPLEQMLARVGEHSQLPSTQLGHVDVSSAVGTVAWQAQVARVHLRVSTDEQDLARREANAVDARAAGYLVASV